MLCSLFLHELYVYIFVAGRGQQISNTHDTYLISADTAALADDWVAAIRRVMHEVCVCAYCMVDEVGVSCTAVWWGYVWTWSGGDNGGGS